jgi:hypothetical protein
MTLAEFKAWFEGFTEGMEAAPDEKQWERIKARVKEINGVAVTKTVFVDHYVEPYRRYWPNVPYWSGQAFSSNTAMLDLGKAEYRAALNN